MLAPRVLRRASRQLPCLKARIQIYFDVPFYKGQIDVDEDARQYGWQCRFSLLVCGTRIIRNKVSDNIVKALTVDERPIERKCYIGVLPGCSQSPLNTFEVFYASVCRSV